MESSRRGSLPNVETPADVETSLRLGMPPELVELEQDRRSLAVLELLWDQRRIIWRVTMMGTIGAIILALTIPNSYQATTRLMPPDENRSTSALAVVAQLTGNSASGLNQMLGLKGSASLFIGILRSRTLEDRIVARFNLKDVYGTSLEEDARKRLEENTTTSEDGKSGIISVSVIDKDSRRAAAIANAYVQELDRLAAELTTSAAHRERVFIEERLKVVKQELDAAAAEFGEFASKNRTIDIREQGRAMVDAAARLQGEVIAAESQLRGLQQIYTDSNVRVRALKARIAELRGQLARLGGGQSGGGIGPQAKDQSLYPSISQLPLLGAKYGDLYRRTKIQEAVFETLTKQYELAKVEEAKEIPTVRVLDAAEPPERKIGPRRMVITLFGASLSFAVAVLWILGSARWRELDPEDSRKAAARFLLTKAEIQLQQIQSKKAVQAVLRRIPRRSQLGQWFRQKPPEGS